MCSFHGNDGNLQGLSESITFSGDLPYLHGQGKPSFLSYFSVRRVNIMGTESQKALHPGLGSLEAESLADELCDSCMDWPLY